MAKWKTVSKKATSKKEEVKEYYIDPVTGYKIQLCKPGPATKLRTANC